MSPVRRKFLVGAFVALFLAVLFLFSLSETTSLRKQETRTLQDIRALQFNYVEGVLSELLQNTNPNSRWPTQSQIISFYQSHPERSLSMDLSSLDQSGQSIVTIIEHNIKEKPLDTPSSVPGDPFLLMKNASILLSLLDQFQADPLHQTNYNNFENELKSVTERYDAAILLNQVLSLCLAFMFLACFVAIYTIEDREMRKEQEKK